MSTRNTHRFSAVLSLMVVLTLALTAGGAPLAEQRFTALSICSNHQDIPQSTLLPRASSYEEKAVLQTCNTHGFDASIVTIPARTATEPQPSTSPQSMGFSTESPAAPSLGLLTRISVSNTGEQANERSFSPKISGDGRYVAFTSYASNLVPYDANNRCDVFVYDLHTGEVELVSVSSTGVQGNSCSMVDSISDDGNVVVFTSWATTLVPGDTNYAGDVFIRNRRQRRTERISVTSTGGQANGNSRTGIVSADGRFVVFLSSATNLTQQGCNHDPSIFLYDQQTGSVECIECSCQEGYPQWRPFDHPTMAPNNRYIAYESLIRCCPDPDGPCYTRYDSKAVVYDRWNATRVFEFVGTNGCSNYLGSLDRGVSLSYDGRLLAFTSDYDTRTDPFPYYPPQVWVYDFQRGRLDLLSKGLNGNRGNERSGSPDISYDGRFVSFRSAATNLVAGDTNGSFDIFLYDRETNTLRVISRTPDQQANGSSWSATMSADGRFIAFDSSATNLVPFDTNGYADVFVYDRLGGWPTISGRVTDASGHGIPGVTVWAGFPRNTSTDASGNYTFTGLPAGTYTVRPEKDPYVFSPESRAVTVPPSATSVNFTGQVPIVHVKLLYVPLNWQNTQAAFDAEADLQSSIFFDQVPLSACPEKYRVEKLSVAAQNFTSFTCSGDAIGSIREFLQQQGINAEDYTAVIGLAETSPCPPTGGQSNGTNTVWVTAEYDIVTAHELGHIWGLSDQYCSVRNGMSTDGRCNDGDIQGDGAQTGDVNWLDSSLPCDCPPDWSADSTGAQCCNFTTTCNKPEGCYFKGVFIAGYNQSYLRRCDSEDYGELGIVHVNYGACCLGNKTSGGGRSIMSFANAPGPRAFDIHDLAHLNTRHELNCDVVTAAQTTAGGLPSYVRQLILDVNLLVHQNDSVQDKGVRVTWGRPTSDSVLQGLDGNYAIAVFNASGAQVWSQAFPLYFDYTGPVVLGEDYSDITYDSRDVAFRIPYTCGMSELRLYHNGRTIFSKTLPTVCPIYLPLVLRTN